VIHARETGDAAEALDSVRYTRIIGGDDDSIDTGGLCGASIHVLDHRTSVEIGERFSW
jgi:hypothetical protein